MQTQQSDEPEFVVVPLEAQIAMSTFLYAKYQENVTRRLDKYLTFPQWLRTLDRSPHQLEDYPELEDEGLTVQEFYFAAINWHFFRWQIGAASVIGNEYITFEISLIFFTLIWITQNVTED